MKAGFRLAGWTVLGAHALAAAAAVTIVAPRLKEDTRVDAPLASVSSPCIAVPVKGAHILLSQSLLAGLARQRPAIHPTSADKAPASDAERLAQIRGDRAETILERAEPGHMASGCTVSTLSDPYPGQDALQLIGQLIEQGQAMVMRDGATAPELRVVVHDHNYPNSGVRDFEFLGGGMFLMVYMWVA